MQVGTILVDRDSGLKLLVVEAASDDSRARSVSVDGRGLEIQRQKPSGRGEYGQALTTDPGMRG